MNELIQFKNIKPSDFNLLHHWLQKQHVREFWDDGHRTLEQVKLYYADDQEVKRYLIYADGQPIGYIHYYIISSNSKYSEYAQYILSDGETLGIDIFIGEASFLGKGLSGKILSRFIDTCCAMADRVIVDPRIDNKKAIHIYQKYGFSQVGTFFKDENQYNILALNIRKTVRAIVLNSKNEVLLVRIEGGPTKAKNESFWCTLGGRIEKNESEVEALFRELKEEAGIENVGTYTKIAFGEQLLEWHGTPTRLFEHFYCIHVDSIALHTRMLTSEEKDLIKEYHWWPQGDLLKTGETIYPPCLRTLITEYLQTKEKWQIKKIKLN